MPLADYAHWNEEAAQVWWQEEGRHAERDTEYGIEDRHAAADAWCEDTEGQETETLREMLKSDSFVLETPWAAQAIRDWIADRERT